jgi:hypothetical protein
MTVFMLDEIDDGRLTEFDLALLCRAARHYAECVVQAIEPDEMRLHELHCYDRAVRHARAAGERLHEAELRRHGADRS